MLLQQEAHGAVAGALKAREECAGSQQQCALCLWGTVQPADQSQARAVVSKLSDGQEAILTVLFPSQSEPFENCYES